MQDSEYATSGELPHMKEFDASSRASDEYLEKTYLFKMFKTATMDTLANASSCDISSCPGAAQSSNTLETLPAEEEYACEVITGKPKGAAIQKQVTVPPAWGMHALYILGYSVKEILGFNESNAVVTRRCETAAEGHSVAVKCLSTRNQELRDSIQKEYHILNQMSHKSIVVASEFHQSRFDMWLCMEYCQDTVEARVNRDGPIRRDSKEIQLLRELAEGVDYLHTLGGVAHRDLKPSSLLLKQTESGIPQLKIGGFSRARTLAGRVALGAGAHLGLYSAPEVWHNHMGMEEPADIFSLGLCLCFMLLGEAGLPVRLTDSIALNSFMMLGLPERCWPGVGVELELLLRQCLLPQPNSRPDASDLLAEAAFPGVRSPRPPAR